MTVTGFVVPSVISTGVYVIPPLRHFDWRGEDPEWRNLGWVRSWVRFLHSGLTASGRNDERNWAVAHFGRNDERRTGLTVFGRNDEGGTLLPIYRGLPA